MLIHANGECGCQGNNADAHKRSKDERGRFDGGTVLHDGLPLSQITRGYSVAAGMGSEDHSDDCLRNVIWSARQQFPDVEWPDVPGDYECDCEKDLFSRSQCEGCGSYLHGERHAMTLFKDTPRKRAPRSKTRPMYGPTGTYQTETG
jgi:hypothetical protein